MPENDPTLEFYNSLMCDQMTPTQADNAGTGERASAATAERELDAMADQRKCAKKQAA